jgi:hypothetical protein
MNVRRSDLSWPNASKADIVAEIAGLLGVDVPPMSTGSTEPREIFVVVNHRLGLGLRENGTKQELARGIVEAAGQAWHPDYESSGATVTKPGLLAVLDAVVYFVR